ncbi:MAG: hypothetical protein IID46_06025 [Planctomycetes bacterium]|nr:hypothetical protein [Planctomycetota bacterium]
MNRGFNQILTAIVILIPSASYGQVKLILTPDGPKNVSEKTTKKEKRRSRNLPQLFKLSISPASEPDPALKYSLLPEYRKQKPGNAAPYYYRALLSFAEWSGNRNRKFYDKYNQWMESPISELPKEDVRKALRPFENVYRNHLKIAAYREECDWDWRIRDLNGFQSIAFPLLEIQESRDLARFLALKARLEIAEGRLQDALETLKVGYQLAHDVAIPPTLINDLVGIAIAHIMNNQLIELIKTPGSPNMYWAIAQLPDPFIDMRPAMEYEKLLPGKMFPFLLDAETARRTPEEWRAVFARSMKDLDSVGSSLFSGLGFYSNRNNFESDNNNLKANLAATALILAGYPRAKKELLNFGYSTEQIEKMPVGQVVAIYQSRITHRMTDEMFKWSHLPIRQALQGMEKSLEKLKREGYFGRLGQSREILPIAMSLLPATTHALSAQGRLQTRLAGLQTLEAIRMHAADNNGKLPNSLDKITVVPVPNNPSTGKPFNYRLEGNTAVLDVPGQRGIPQTGWKLEITVRPTGK